MGPFSSIGSCRVNASVTHRNIVKCPSRDRSSRRDVMGISLQMIGKF